MFNQKRRIIVVEEKDLTTVLAVLNNHRGFFDSKEKTIENCGWADEPTKWFIKFDASNKHWGRIADELKQFGKFYVNVTRRGTTDLCFERN